MFRFSSILLLLMVGTVSCQEIEQPKTVLSQEQWKRVKEDILKEAPQFKYPINAIFDDKIELLGMDIEGPMEAGKKLTFTWYWKALKPIKKDWTIFVHLDSGAGKFRQNVDHVPVEDMYPTSHWKVGDIIRDKKVIVLKNDVPNGSLSTFMGLFRGNYRMPISNGAKKTKDSSPRIIGPKLSIKSKHKGAIQPTYSLSEISAANLHIDGKLDEDAWKTRRPFRLKGLGNAPNLSTKIKAFVSENNLFIGAELEDHHIWGSLHDRDDETWKEEVLEMFLDFDGDGKDYLELQITPLGTIFDANFKTQLGGANRAQQIKNAKAFNLPGLEYKVLVDGTLNDNKADKSWTVEIKIPLASIPGFSPAVLTENKKWKINFYRFDRPEKSKSFAYAWSTAPAGDFHQVNKYGSFVIRKTAKTLTPDEIKTIQDKISPKLKLNIDPNALEGVKVKTPK